MKRKVLIIVLILKTIYFANAQEKTFDISVQIEGLKSNKGNIFIALYNEKDQFLKNPYKSAITKILNKKGKYLFKRIPVGEYAISFFHDENNNKKMDTNFLGIPKETYGVSNNVKNFMGPPKYENAKFQLFEKKTILIKN